MDQGPKSKDSITQREKSTGTGTKTRTETVKVGLRSKRLGYIWNYETGDLSCQDCGSPDRKLNLFYLGIELCLICCFV